MEAKRIGTHIVVVFTEHELKSLRKAIVNKMPFYEYPPAHDFWKTTHFPAIDEDKMYKHCLSDPVKSY